MDTTVLRELTLEAMLASPRTDFWHLSNAVAALAEGREIPGLEYSAGSPVRVPLPGPLLSSDDSTKLQEVVWDLIVARVLTPGTDALNPQWPLLRMTERGRRMANEELGRST